MLNIEDIKEFYEMPGYDKFKNNIYGNDFGVTFKNGTIAVCWFASVKGRIFESDNYYCQEIKKQYDEYTEHLKKSGSMEIKKTPFQDSIAIFMKIKNLDKFVINLPFPTLYFTTTAEFFRTNGKYILNSDSPHCAQIRKQYIKHKIKYRNQRNEFYRELNLDKFELDCDLVFPSYPNEKMAEWFLRYKEYISQIAEPIEEEIMLHYEIYNQERGPKTAKQKKKNMRSLI